MIILQFQGPFTGPLEPSQNMFRGGPPGFQVGQALSNPTVIRTLAIALGFEQRGMGVKNLHFSTEIAFILETVPYRHMVTKDH